jgi:hypothetical protein
LSKLLVSSSISSCSLSFIGRFTLPCIIQICFLVVQEWFWFSDYY